LKLFSNAEEIQVMLRNPNKASLGNPNKASLGNPNKASVEV
jgi:hypothetical protein